MYGPRSAYSSQDLAEHDERVKDASFQRRLIAALKHPDVLRALATAVSAALSAEAVDRKSCD